jgi:hypothetical protein
VNPPGMHEHGSEQCWKINKGVCNEAAGNERPLHNKSVAAAHFHQKKQDVQSDQAVRDHWKNSAATIIITDWKHKIYLLFIMVGFVTKNINAVTTTGIS